MFLAETFSLSFVFGGAGILLGVITTWIVRPLQIGSGGNEIFELLFGGRGLPADPGIRRAGAGDRRAWASSPPRGHLPRVVARKITPAGRHQPALGKERKT